MHVQFDGFNIIWNKKIIKAKLKLCHNDMQIELSIHDELFLLRLSMSFLCHFFLSVILFYNKFLDLYLIFISIFPFSPNKNGQTHVWLFWMGSCNMWVACELVSFVKNRYGNISGVMYVRERDCGPLSLPSNFLTALTLFTNVVCTSSLTDRKMS